MLNKIQVDLELAVKKLGFKDIESALKQNPGLVKSIAAGLGTSVEDALALSVSKGVERGLERAMKNKVARVEGLFGTRLNLKDFIEKSLGPQPQSKLSAFYAAQEKAQTLRTEKGQRSHVGLGSRFMRYMIERGLLESLGVGSGPSRILAALGSGVDWAGLSKRKVDTDAIKNLVSVSGKMEGGKFNLGAKFAGGDAAKAGLVELGAAAGAVAAGLGMAVTATYKFVEKMTEVAEKASHLFEHAARIGTSTGKTFMAEELAKVFGVSPERMDELILRGQGLGNAGGGNRRGFGFSANVPDIDAMIRSGRGVGSAGDIQQIDNMWRSTRDYVASITGMLKDDATIMQNAAGIAKRITLGRDSLKREEETFKGNITRLFGPETIGWLDLLTNGFHKLNMTLDKSQGFVENARARFEFLLAGPDAWRHQSWRDFIHHDDLPQNNQRIAGFGRETHFSSLERMGLVVGGQHDRVFTVLQQIERNTRPNRGAAAGAIPSGRYAEANPGTNADRAIQQALGIVGSILNGGINLP